MVRRALPERTCVGCRRRAPADELLRIVALGDEAGGYSLRPDPARRMPGRGANMHPDPACFAQAVRRRAFGRALRVTAVIDHGELAEHVHASSPTSGQPDRARVASKVGRPT
ncbi:YlxR family protein [Micromonospora sp. PLK6-60]|uniref:YlxR family protein n=1 Tax=Micromonospora sp. PLK6-60 TaxID=2873383 RepID=UPI001CA63922|nr:YlxR family protein [Micromonospora sp. PLK6-60]MBY8871037.1 YlxR family protein [Micromonospora sp. PLK6-60]